MKAAIVAVRLFISLLPYFHIVSLAQSISADAGGKVLNRYFPDDRPIPPTEGAV
jgi:hypothetical protein